jgi:hypothetical protein
MVGRFRTKVNFGLRLRDAIREVALSQCNPDVDKWPLSETIRPCVNAYFGVAWLWS